MVCEEFWRKDGPYSWVVLITLIMSRLLSAGFGIATTGVLADEFPRHFGVEQAQTNVIGSTLLGIFLFSVPIITILMKITGVRAMSVVGAVLIIAGIIPTAYATKVWHAVLSYSIVTTLGFSISTAASLGIVRHYFERRKAAAFACLGVGAGIAQIVFPYVVARLLEAYGYKLMWLYISPVFLLNILTPIVFIEQIPADKPKSASYLFHHYIDSFKHFITPAFLLNSFFTRSAQLAAMALLFTHISENTDNQTAVNCYIGIGVSFLVATSVLLVTMLRFKLNCFILHIVVCLTIGVVVCVMAAFSHPMLYYVCSAILALCHGSTLTIKGGLSVHVYPPDTVEYSYGVSEAVGGIGSFIFPLATGYIQKSYGSSSGLYFLAGLEFFGTLVYIVAAMIRPSLWTSYEKRKGKKENTTTDDDNKDGIAEEDIEVNESDGGQQNDSFEVEENTSSKDGVNTC